MRIAEPAGRAGGRRGPRAPWRARAARARRPPTPRPPPPSARGTRGGRRPPSRCAPPPRPRPPRTRRPSAPRRARRARRTAPAPRTARRRRPPPRAAARSSARPPRPPARATQSAVVTTASLPHEIAVWRRSPRRVASALTTRLPLWETSATWPGGAGDERVAPQRRARCSAISPSQFGPHTGSACRAAAARELGFQRRARDDSPKPAAYTTAPPAAERARPPRSTAGTPRGRDRDHDRVGRRRQVATATGSTAARAPTRAAG